MQTTWAHALRVAVSVFFTPIVQPFPAGNESVRRVSPLLVWPPPPVGTEPDGQFTEA